MDNRITRLIKNIMFILIYTFSFNLIAQQPESLKTQKAQVTFAYPVGSSGKNSPEYSNSFSFNILYGINGGVHGFEMGSLFNVNKGQVNGFQLSGIFNLNNDDSRGFLISGVSNICNDSSAGALISGVLNYTNSNSKGFQLSTINIVNNEFKGFQLGVINYAKKLRGVQFGVLNILNDKEHGLPIGVLSIVKNGHYELELTAGEVIYSNLNYKMGLEKFYTIFKTGFSIYEKNPVYSYGIGFGSNINLSEKQLISIDLSYNTIIYNNNWEGNLNILNKADFNYKYSISDKVALLVGPSFNIYVTEEQVIGEYGTLNIPYTIYTTQSSGRKTSMWFGFNAGLSVKL